MSADTAIKRANRLVQAMSAWINDSNREKSAGHLMWLRLAKVGEEAGEVISALVGAEGSNPRKGVEHGWEAVDKELLDTAATALYAYHHRSGDKYPIQALITHLEYLDDRVGAEHWLSAEVGS